MIVEHRAYERYVIETCETNSIIEIPEWYFSKKYFNDDNIMFFESSYEQILHTI